MKPAGSIDHSARERRYHPGSGGLRKIRWKLEGQGKRGGVRVIYYWVTADDQIRMLYVYRKTQQADLTPKQLATLKSIVERW